MRRQTAEMEKHYSAKRESVKFTIEEKDFTFTYSNGFDHRELLIVPQDDFDTLTPAIWGLMDMDAVGANQNEYYKRVKGAGLNARSEKAFDHFLYRELIWEKRCIIPITGFFEYQHHNSGKLKIPHYIGRKDAGIISVAGLYSITSDGYATCTILTKDASPTMAEIHNSAKRQPIMLHPDFERDWVEQDLSKYQLLEFMNVQYPDDELNYYPVAKDFKNHGEYYEEALQPFNYPELGQMGMF